MQADYRLLNRRAAIAVVSLFTVAACAEDPVAVNQNPVAVQITGVPDSLAFAGTVTAGLEVRNADGVELSNYDVVWSSSRSDILSVSSNGAVTASRPGSAFIRARVGTATDSVLISVATAYPVCPTGTSLGAISNFTYGTFFPGSVQVWHDFTLYLDQPTLFAGGITFGVDGATTASGWWPGRGGSDFNGGMCRMQDDYPVHLVSKLGLGGLNGAVPRSTGVPGLSVMYDVYAFDSDVADDFVLFRYAFTNDGNSAITALRVGQVMDFDLQDGGQNVGSFNPVSGVADVIDGDSAANPIVSGFLAIDESVATYKPWTQPVNMTRDQTYELLDAGIPGSLRTGPADVRQLISIAPFNLAVGETRVVWFAMVGGENRTAFDQNVGAAIAMARLID